MKKRLWRHTGHALIGLGILHTVVFVTILSGPLIEMLMSGLFNSIGVDPSSAARGLAWYGGLWFGVNLILFGCLAQSWIKATARPLPRYVGWVLAAAGLLGAILQPVSGAPLVLILGLIIAFTRLESTNQGRENNRR